MPPRGRVVDVVDVADGSVVEVEGAVVAGAPTRGAG
jgi:hypothetical protein